MSKVYEVAPLMYLENKIISMMNLKFMRLEFMMKLELPLYIYNA